MTIEPAVLGDLPWLVEHDSHISKEALRISISLGRVTLLKHECIPLGWYRYNLFWDSIPFLNMLYLLEPYRGLGYGSLLMEHWEKEMKKQGYSQLITSTLAEEQAQHFYRACGYKDAGMLLLPPENTELFFYKDNHEGNVSFSE